MHSMYQIRSRQIARLENLARPYLKQKVGIAERWRKIRHGAVTHAAGLAFLLRYGEPRLGEPLSAACQRVAESEGWKLYRETMPPRSKFIKYEEHFAPHGRGSVMDIGEVLRHLFISTLPGVDEKAKLNAIFKSAPAWLIWFTFADYTAAVLGLKLPDLTGVRGFMRSREAFDGWWGLPDGAFECNAWPKDCESELAATDLSLLRPEPAHDQFMTRRARKRAPAPRNWTDEWPSPLPLEWLQLVRTDFRSAMAQAGDERFMPDKRHPEFCGDMSPAARYRGNFPKG